MDKNKRILMVPFFDMVGGLHGRMGRLVPSTWRAQESSPSNISSHRHVYCLMQANHAEGCKNHLKLDKATGMLNFVAGALVKKGGEVSNTGLEGLQVTMQKASSCQTKESTSEICTFNLRYVIDIMGTCVTTWQLLCMASCPISRTPLACCK